MARRADQALKCPSAQPGMGDVQVLGVISRDGDKPVLAYLDEPVAPTPEMLALVEPLPVSHVLRLSARCEDVMLGSAVRAGVPRHRACEPPRTMVFICSGCTEKSN